MFSSVVAGVTGLAAWAEAFFLLPGDTPLIRSSTIKAIVKEYRKTGAAVVQPVFNAQKGHPPLIGNKCFNHILRQETATGLRGILDQFAAETRELPVVDSGVLLDIDRPADYKNLLFFYGKWEIPTVEECRAILCNHQVNDNVMRHVQAVAALATRMAGLLNDAGLNLSLDLTAAGGLLHDVAKGKPHHARRGGRLLVSYGFPAVARIVACHMDIEFAADTAIDEAAVVFLADKLIQGDNPVTLAEHFRPALMKFAGSPAVVAQVLRRMRTAETISDRVVDCRFFPVGHVNIGRAGG